MGPTNQHYWIGGAKILLVIVLIYTLYRQIWGHDYWASFLALCTPERWIQQWPLLLFVFILMPINWLIEARKWWLLLQRLAPSPYRTAVRAVFAGISLSLFTPHRVGEYGGRILSYPTAMHPKVLLASLVANYGQLLCLLTAGCLGIFHIGRSFLPENGILFYGILLLGSLGLVLLWWSFLAVHQLMPLLQGWQWPKWLTWLPKTLVTAGQFDQTLLLRSASWAGLRFLIYSVQFVLLLIFFGLDIPWHILLSGVFVIYLLQSGLPLPPALGMLTRGELGILVWHGFEANPLAILAASLALFIINLAIPALLGVMVIVKTNITKSLNDEGRAD